MAATSSGVAEDVEGLEQRVVVVSAEQHRDAVSVAGHLEPLDYILANLPYVDPEWQTSPELRHEPARALYADDGGLALILKLIPQAARHLQPNGVLFLEADPEQHPRIIELAMQHGFQHETTLGYALALRFVRTER